MIEKDITAAVVLVCLREWVAPVNRKSESAVLQKSESAMLYFLIFCTEVGENYVIHTNL